jgi:hypothetical protein
MLLYCICLSCQVYGYVIKDAIHYYSRPSYSIRNSYKQFRIPYFTKRSLDLLEHNISSQVVVNLSISSQTKTVR